MSTGEGPARNTRARTARRERARARQSSPPPEEARVPEPTEISAQHDAPPEREESILTSIAEPSSIKSEQLEETSPSEENPSSDHETIRDIPEETYEPEQSYTTAPSLSADPRGFESSTPTVALDKGKGRAFGTPPRSETSTSPWGRRDTPPHLSYADEEWAQIDAAINSWTALVEKNKAEAIQHRQELTDLQERVTNSYHRSSDTIDTMQGIRKMFD